jgi:hypothetical protein
MNQSDKFTLNSADLIKIGKGLLIALGGAALTYLSTIVTKVDFGVYTPLAVAIFSTLINTASKALAGK